MVDKTSAYLIIFKKHLKQDSSNPIFYLRSLNFNFNLGATKILFLTTQLPYPPKSGGTVKSWNYVRFLAANYQLSVACLLKDDDEKHTSSFLETVSIDALISEKVSVSRSPLNLLKSYLFAPCLNAFRNYSKKFAHQINEIASSYDAIIVDHYEVFQYVPTTFRGKVIMHTHNAEFMLWQRMSELTNHPLKKLILKLEANRVKRYEKTIFSQSDLIYSTPSDIALYKEHDFKVEKHRITYHLGNDHLLELPNIERNTTEKALSFIGTLSWEPNIDGLVWFLDHVWPQVLAKHSDCKLYVLGKSPDQRILAAAKGNPQVVFTGFVNDLDEYLRKTRVYLAPLRFGSGMKVKVLEGLYRGVPSVSTSVGAEGLEVRSGEEILIADEAPLFAQHCIALLDDVALWNKLRDQSRIVAKANYQWAPLFEKMDVEFNKCFTK